jgi:four helix bundle protein
MSKRVLSHRELEVYQRAFEAALGIHEASKSLPKEEIYSLTDQIRRSSRSVCANLAEAWRRRRYEAAFINKLSECEAEVAETQVWLEFAAKCGYLDRDRALAFYNAYDRILATLVGMINHPESWILTPHRDYKVTLSPAHPVTLFLSSFTS